MDGDRSSSARYVAEAKGRKVDAKLDRDAAGKATAQLTFDVPLFSWPRLTDGSSPRAGAGVSSRSRDPQAPEGRTRPPGSK